MNEQRKGRGTPFAVIGSTVKLFSVVGLAISSSAYRVSEN
jgi:hypothetical protein